MARSQTELVEPLSVSSHANFIVSFTVPLSLTAEQVPVPHSHLSLSRLVDTSRHHSKERILLYPVQLVYVEIFFRQ